MANGYKARDFIPAPRQNFGPNYHQQSFSAGQYGNPNYQMQNQQPPQQAQGQLQQQQQQQQSLQQAQGQQQGQTRSFSPPPQGYARHADGSIRRMG